MKKLFLIAVLFLILGTAAQSQKLTLVSNKYYVAVYNPQDEEMEHIHTEEGRTFIEIYTDNIEITGQRIVCGYDIKTLENRNNNHVFELVNNIEETTLVFDPGAKLATFIFGSRGNVYTLTFTINKAY